MYDNVTTIGEANTQNSDKGIHVVYYNEETTTNKILPILEKELGDAKMDFIYLSTPETLIEKLTSLNDTEYLSYDYSRIFLSTKDFINYTSQETKNFKLSK